MNITAGERIVSTIRDLSFGILAMLAQHHYSEPIGLG